MKLEKGKWYKWFQTSHCTNHIGKFDSISNNDTVRMKPWILQTTSYNVSGAFESKFMQDIVEITDLTEIQKLLPDGHVDKIESKSERYIATMKFFEQLREPERSEAIANYDENYTDNIPSSLSVTLMNGFDWCKSKQGSSYWDNIYDSIANNTYFKKPETETLVFGKYKIGDVVVSLTTNGSSRKEGSLFTVREDSLQDKLCYDTYYGSINSNDWRLATPEEVEAYNIGIKNIADIKPKDYNEAVNCTTQEEWDFVLSKFNPKGVVKDDWNEHSDNICMVTASSSNSAYLGCFNSKGYFISNSDTILTFKKWCDKYEHTYVKEETMFKKGDYIVTLINHGGCGKVNYCSKQQYDETYLNPEIDTRGDTDNGNCEFTFSDKSKTKWRFATKEEGEEYERHGKPYDVGLLLSSKIPDKPSGLITRDASILNTFISMYDTFDMYGNKVYPITPKEVYPTLSIPKPTTIILKTKSKSIKL